MQKPNLAEQALIQAWNILCLLSTIDHNKQWIEHSIPKYRLDKLARMAGSYRDVEHLVSIWDKDNRPDDFYDVQEF